MAVDGTARLWTPQMVIGSWFEEQKRYGMRVSTAVWFVVAMS
jgi:hypothetical protein